MDYTINPKLRIMKRFLTTLRYVRNDGVHLEEKGGNALKGQPKQLEINKLPFQGAIGIIHSSHRALPCAELSCAFSASPHPANCRHDEGEERSRKNLMRISARADLQYYNDGNYSTPHSPRREAPLIPPEGGRLGTRHTPSQIANLTSQIANLTSPPSGGLGGL